MESQQILLTLKETAGLLRVSYGRVADLVRRGVIPSCRLGRQIRVPTNQLLSFIDTGGKSLPNNWKN